MNFCFQCEHVDSFSGEQESMQFRSSSQSGGEDEKVSRFLIFVNTSILFEAAAHKKAAKRPVIKCKAVLTARLQMPLPECFPEA